MKLCPICTKPMFHRHSIAVIEPVSVSLMTSIEQANDARQMTAKTLDVCSRDCYAAACCVVEFIRDIGRRFVVTTLTEVETEKTVVGNLGLFPIGELLSKSWARRTEMARWTGIQIRMNGQGHCDVSSDLESVLKYAREKA